MALTQEHLETLATYFGNGSNWGLVKPFCQRVNSALAELYDRKEVPLEFTKKITLFYLFSQKTFAAADELIIACQNNAHKATQAFRDVKKVDCLITRKIVETSLNRLHDMITELKRTRIFEEKKKATFSKRTQKTISILYAELFEVNGYEQQINELLDELKAPLEQKGYISRAG